MNTCQNNRAVTPRASSAEALLAVPGDEQAQKPGPGKGTPGRPVPRNPIPRQRPKERSRCAARGGNGAGSGSPAKRPCPRTAPNPRRSWTGLVVARAQGVPFRVEKNAHRWRWYSLRKATPPGWRPRRATTPTSRVRQWTPTSRIIGTPAVVTSMAEPRSGCLAMRATGMTMSTRGLMMSLNRGSPPGPAGGNAGPARG